MKWRGNCNRVLLEEALAQAPCVRVTNVIDPTLDAGIQFGERDVASPEQGDVSLQALSKVHNVAALQFTIGRIDDKAKPGDALINRRDVRSTFMES
jgi:hypothetical protein